MSRRLASLLSLFLLGIVSSIVFTSTTDLTEAQTTGTWNASFFANTSFTPPAAATVTYTNAQMSIQNWGAGSPAANVPADNFSAVFTTTQVLTQGTWQFRVYADDQAELRVNGQLLIDINVPGQQAIDYQVPFTSTYSIEVRYVELTSTAALQVQFVQSGIVPGGATFTPQPTVPPTRTPLPAIPPGALTATVIRAGVLNTRDAPSLGGNVLGRILRGETYAVLGRDEDARWFLLQLGGYQAWSFGYYLFINGNEFNPPVVSGNSILGLAGQPDYGVRAQSEATLRLRQGPSVGTRQIGRVTWGAFLPIIGRTPDGYWYQTVWKGTVGWIYSPFLEIIEGDLNNVPFKNG